MNKNTKNTLLWTCGFGLVLVGWLWAANPGDPGNIGPVSSDRMNIGNLQLTDGGDGTLRVNGAPVSGGGYTPGTPANWSTQPTNSASALDILAAATANGTNSAALNAAKTYADTLVASTTNSPETWVRYDIPWTSVTNGFKTNSIYLTTLLPKQYVSKVVMSGSLSPNAGANAVVRGVGVTNALSLFTGNAYFCPTDQVTYAFAVFDVPSVTANTNLVYTIYNTLSNLNTVITSGTDTVWVLKGTLP